MAHRKILYSPGRGAGWTSWNTGDVAKFMLEYQPLIEAIESKTFTYRDNDPVVLQMVKEAQEKFGANYVCVLGADQLKIAEVTGRVRISEYYGSEGIEEEGDFQGWL